MSDLIERLNDEADLCRNDGANDIADLLDEAIKRIAELESENNRLKKKEIYAWLNEHGKDE